MMSVDAVWMFLEIKQPPTSFLKIWMVERFKHQVHTVQILARNRSVASNSRNVGIEDCVVDKVKGGMN